MAHRHVPLCRAALLPSSKILLFLEMGDFGKYHLFVVNATNASLCLQKERLFLINTESSALICRLLYKLTVPIVRGKGCGTEPFPAFDLCRSDVWPVIIKRLGRPVG